MLHSMWFWAAFTFAIVLGVSFVPVAGLFVLAPLASLLLGAVAAAWGWSNTSTSCSLLSACAPAQHEPPGPVWSSTRCSTGWAGSSDELLDRSHSGEIEWSQLLVGLTRLVKTPFPERGHAGPRQVGGATCSN